MSYSIICNLVSIQKEYQKVFVEGQGDNTGVKVNARHAGPGKLGTTWPYLLFLSIAGCGGPLSWVSVGPTNWS